jgi:D-beta-D-heptose 7-phosphate kinase/D-beta-D-heptose 1-phosphate adenosyltransferase
MALAGGLSPRDGAYMANLAASVVVAKLGTYAVSRDELMKVLKGE